MKYVVLIMDGAAGYPLKEHGHKTSLEIAKTPHLDQLAADGTLGLSLNVPEGMEPSSAVACRGKTRRKVTSWPATRHIAALTTGAAAQEGGAV